MRYARAVVLMGVTRLIPCLYSAGQKPVVLLDADNMERGGAYQRVGELATPC
jgi:hypothetical protein